MNTGDGPTRRLIIVLAVSLAATALFAYLAAGISGGGSFLPLDERVAAWQRANATPAGTFASEWLSKFGSGFATTTIGLVIGFLLLREKRWLLLGGWAAALLIGDPLVDALKDTFDRVRPNGGTGDQPGHSWSFPSGHAMSSFICYAMLAYVVSVAWARRRRHRIALLAACGAMILLIGISRMYLGVHYLSDVIAGWAGGAVWVACCVSGLEWAKGRARS